MDKDIETIKRRLKRKDAWRVGYIDDLVESTVRIMQNELYNKGIRAQCNFLMQNGVSVDEIVEEGKKVRKLISKHMKGIVSDTKHRHRNSRSRQ